MKSKRKTTIRILVLILAVVFITCNIRIENVSAFWNQDNPSDRDNRKHVQMQIQLMHCNHKDTHYVNGAHIKGTTGDTEIKSFPITPRVNDDIKAGTEIYDCNKYFYEYELSYNEGSDVDYAVITQPYITHFSKAEAAAKGVVEKNNRMYWVGEYSSPIANLKDSYIEDPNNEGNATPGTNGAIDWFDFKGTCYPIIDYSLSQQTWQTVENMENQDVRQFIVNPDVGDDAANGQRFIYLREGTFMNKDIGDSNHPDNQGVGVPAYYGSHIEALIGLVFYRSVNFDANGGTLVDGSVLNMRVYNGNNKSRIIPWYENLDKSKWYSNVNVLSPQVSTAYGTASVKKPTREGYNFLGWFDSPDGGIPVYDTDGNAVLTYTDASGSVVSSPYFDSNGNWIYRGNVTAYAGWVKKGTYTLHYELGASNSSDQTPADQTAYVDESVTISSKSVSGSDYTITYEPGTNNEHSVTDASDALKQVRGRFTFTGWLIEGTLYKKGQTYFKDGLKNGDVITATGQCADYRYRLPSATSYGYTFEGWYDSYDRDTGTFGTRVGSAGDLKSIAASDKSVSITLYAKWEKDNLTLNFDYNVPSTAKNSPLGYVLSGADTTSKYVQLGNPIGTLPSPTLTGYSFNNWSWRTDPNIYVPEDTIYTETSPDTLYAMWSPTRYTIRYDYAGGTAPADNPDSANYYDVLTVTAPSLAGASFAGWEITGMDGSTHLLDGTKSTNETAYGVGSGKTSVKLSGLRSTQGEVTLKAVWKYASYNIVYDFNGGSAYPGGSYPSSANVWDIFYISNPVGENGSVFAGWTVSGMDEGDHIVCGTSASGTRTSGAGKGKASGTELVCQNMRYSAGTVVLTAAWESPYRQLTFVTDGGTMSGSSVQTDWTMRFIRFGDIRFSLLNSFGTDWGSDVPHVSRRGYTFNGFFTEAEGGEQVFNGLDSAYVSDRLVKGLYWAGNGTWTGPSLILYSQFTPKDYTVTFNLNGGVWTADGSDSVKSLGVTYDSTKNSKVFDSSSVYRKGYIFGGWNISSDGTGDTVYDTDGRCTDEGGYWSGNYRE